MPIALEAIRGEKMIAEIADHHEVRPNKVAALKAQVLENRESMFGAQGLAGDSKEWIPYMAGAKPCTVSTWR